MLAIISYIPDSYLRRLPNPTTFVWNKLGFSVQRLIIEVHNSLLSTWEYRSLALREWADEVVLAIRDLAAHPEQRSSSGSESLIPLFTLSVLNHAIQKCDQYLLGDSECKRLRNIALHFHFNEVLRFLGESRDQQTDSNVSDYEELMSASPGARENVLMKVYFSTILPRVARAFGQAERKNEELATEIWCTLVFRMLCWLLLHDFDKEDVQVGDLSKMYTSRIEMHIY